ncbi:MAG: SO2930 family diheme c-type cytochrome [Blastomonas sp.]
MVRFRLLLSLLCAALLLGANPPSPGVHDDLIGGDTLPQSLSEYGFFLDRAATQPAPGVVPYRLNSPLFSDYAEKFRFAYVPQGKTVATDADGRLLFPVGSALIKSFGYRYEDQGMRLLETRVLLHRESGWVALPYVWNEDRSDAVLRRAGKRMDVNIVQPDGQAVAFSYAVPNQNQCKGCHALKGEITPIGPKLRNLDDGERLADWQQRGWFGDTVDAHEVMPDYADISEPVDYRARAYLDVNCGHCHNRAGPASNSGLYLTWEEADPVALGLYKRPVAAGRGSGGFEFAIEPGHPERSILINRMESTDPGVAMPELGRALVHGEGVDLIREWIAAMPGKAEAK